MVIDVQPVIRAAAANDIEAGLAVVLAAGMFTREDISVVEDLLIRHFAGPPNDRLCLVSENGGSVNAIAYAEATPAADRVWYLTMIGVSPAAQRAGVGSALLQTVESELVDRCQRLLLVETSALTAYEPARRFYRRAGYDEEARVRDFHEDGDDMVLFRKRLPRSDPS